MKILTVETATRSILFLTIISESSTKKIWRRIVDNCPLYSKQLSIIQIECVEDGAPAPGTSIKTHLEKRCKLWQDSLKATSLYGGINKRSTRS